MIFINRFVNSETKRLRYRRTDTIEHRVSARDFEPRRPPIGKRFGACFDEVDIALRFSTFQTARQIDVSEWIKLAHENLATKRHKNHCVAFTLPQLSDPRLIRFSFPYDPRSIQS